MEQIEYNILDRIAISLETIVKLLQEAIVEIKRENDLFKQQMEKLDAIDAAQRGPGYGGSLGG